MTSHSDYPPRMQRNGEVERGLLEPPADVASAHAEFDVLYADIQHIQAQLALRTGDDSAEAVSWRGRANAALRTKQARYGYLKRWLHREVMGWRAAKDEPHITNRQALLAVIRIVLGEPTDDDTALLRQVLVEEDRP